MLIILITLKILNALALFVVAFHSVHWYILNKSITKLAPSQKRLQNEKDFALKTSKGDDYVEVSTKFDVVSNKILRDKVLRDNCVYLIRKFGVPLILLKILIDILKG